MQYLYAIQDLPSRRSELSCINNMTYEMMRMECPKLSSKIGLSKHIIQVLYTNLYMFFSHFPLLENKYTSILVSSMHNLAHKYIC